MLTGSSGYIGSKIDAALHIKGGYEVCTFDEFGDKARWEERFKEEFDCHFDWVIHAGAIMDPEHTNNNIFWWNYECTKEIARYCRLWDSNLLFFSSCQAIIPYNFYGWTKRCASDYIDLLLGDDLPGNRCTVRPFVVYGDEYGRPSKLSTVAKLIKGELPVMFEPWTRDWIHVRDVVRAVVHIIDNDVKGVYDLGTGVGYSAFELFEAWHGTFSDELPPVEGPGGKYYPKDAPAELVAKELLPNLNTRYDVLDYLDEMKKYGNRVY